MTAPVNTVQDAAALLCCQGTLLAPKQLDPPIRQEPQVIFSGAASQPVSPQNCCWQFFFPKWRTLLLPLLNLMKFLLAHSSSLLKFLWTAALLSSVLSWESHHPLCPPSVWYHLQTWTRTLLILHFINTYVNNVLHFHPILWKLSKLWIPQLSKI